LVNLRLQSNKSVMRELHVSLLCQLNDNLSVEYVDRIAVRSLAQTFLVMEAYRCVLRSLFTRYHLCMFYSSSDICFFFLNQGSR
jgi:hypothetical protein